MHLSHWFAALDGFGYDLSRFLLSAVWQSLIVLLVFGVIALFLRRRSAAVRHIVWTVAVLMIPMLPCASYLFSARELPVLPEYTVAAPGEVLLNGDTAGRISGEGIINPAPARESRGNGFTLSHYPWAALVPLYAGGVLFLLLPIAAGRIRVRRWIEEGNPVIDERVVGLCEDLCARLGLRRYVTVVESPRTPVPFTFRFFHPVIVLPAGFADSLSDTELRAVLAHETAHIKRNDIPVIAAVSLVRALFFFHPLVWLAGREISVLAEHACDDLALEMTGTPVSYARLVTRIAETLTARPAVIEHAAGIVFSRKSFMRRVEAILAHRKGVARKLSRPALAGVILAGGCSLAVAFSLPLGEAGKQTVASSPSGNPGG
ncbi:MAG: M56 family metallopeptidase, partial [Candidatus Latescibacterota bacterium]